MELNLSELLQFWILPFYVTTTKPFAFLTGESYFLVHVFYLVYVDDNIVFIWSMLMTTLLDENKIITLNEI